MNNKISSKGKEYLIEKNVGMTDSDGNVIIPKEYDRIIKENDELFAALVDNPNSGITIDTFQGKPIIGARSALTISNLLLIWRRDVKKDIAARNIDFYSPTAKFKCNKKVLAYYYSKINKVLVLLVENYTWSIAYIDYENHEIMEDKRYTNISDIKGIYDARFMIKQNDIYKVISLNDKIEFELPDIIDAKDYPKGLVIMNKEGKYGFVDYSGEEIISCVHNKILPEEDYIGINNFGRQSIWSYKGKKIVPDSYSIIRRQIRGEYFFEIREKVYDFDPILYGLYSVEYGTILPAEYSYLEILGDGTIIYCKDDNWGLAKYRENIHKVLKIIDGYSYMRFNYHGHTRRIIVKKGFKYAIYDTDGSQVRKFRYRWFIPKKDLYMYDYFEWL